MKILILLILLLPISNVFGQKPDPALNNIQIAWQLINNFYVDSVDRDLLAREAIVSMLKKLDPHSVYIPLEEVQAMNEPLAGSFEGVGIEFAILDDTLTVTSTIEGGPSQKIGMLSGDRIVAVDGSNIASIGLKNSDVFGLLRGKKGSIVTMSVHRKGNGSTNDFRVIRDKIPINSVDATYMMTPETGYIKISRFAATTHEEFVDALKKLKKEDMKNLILDLRGNGGGYLKAALDIADEFLENDKLLLYTQGATVPRREYLTTRGGLWENGELIILIDEYSASASEIVAGAIQDWDRGVIMGRRSFGKGLVQRPFNLPDGSEMRLTIAKYYTPSGRSIQKPYDNGSGEYRDEINNRLLHGELVNSDSIHHSKELSFATLGSNRIVYGGGGIMPDIFEPLDTLMYTEFYRELHYTGVFNQFAMKYLDEKRSVIRKDYMKFSDFEKDFSVDEGLLKQLLDEAYSFGVEENLDQLEISKQLIILQLKAFIAKDLWNTSAYFQIMNSISPVVQKAQKTIENQNLYSQILD
jgi:carboxyl-terminal processing protease